MDLNELGWTPSIAQTFEPFRTEGLTHPVARTTADPASHGSSKKGFDPAFQTA